MNYNGVPTNLDFLGIPVDLERDPDTKGLREVFYDATLLYYIWSLIYSDLTEISQVDATDELVQKTLFLHNAIGLVMGRLTTLYLSIAQRLNSDSSIRVSITAEHECIYIELPVPASNHPKINFVKCYIYLPTCYLPSYPDANGTLWVNLGGLPQGTRVLVGNTWLTVN